MDKKMLRKQWEYEDRILELIDHQDELTRSDLQGAVSAIVRTIIIECTGRKPRTRR